MVVIIINPRAGGAGVRAARRGAALASALLRARGEPGEVVITERRGHARELAGEATARGARLVVAWGGDGTVNEVGCALVFGATPLAIVPTGSGNGLARDLGVDPRPARALEAALDAVPRAIDAGEIGGRLFFNLAGVGFDAHVAACFDRAVRRGFWSYVRISLRELMEYRPEVYRIGWDGTASNQRALLVVVANASRFGRNALIAPGARPDDGQLDLVIFEERSRLRTLCALPRFFAGHAAGTPGLTVRRIDRAVLEGTGPLQYHVDGELVHGAARLDVRVHPGALRVAVG
jgi:YegS/Rv2252/BmrU family lipid kinase